jgi:hypothetical protein
MKYQYNPQKDRYEEDGGDYSGKATRTVVVGVLIAMAIVFGYGVYKLINYGIIKL